MVVVTTCGRFKGKALAAGADNEAVSIVAGVALAASQDAMEPTPRVCRT